MGAIKLIVGLGNPGPQYQDTRHNAGAWYIEAIAEAYQVTLKEDKKFFGYTAKLSLPEGDIHLLIPTTFMNRSGQSIQALASYYKIPVEDILVAHDELDFEAGDIRFKEAGGHGGHNGLRDIIAKFGGNNEFLRLRVGIGHPGHKSQVHNYVLTKPSVADRQKIDDAIYDALRQLNKIASGDISGAMNELHTKG